MTGGELLVAEEIFLLVTDDKRGTSANVPGVDRSLAGALLFELAMGGCLAYQGNTFVPGAAAAADHPLLAEVLERVRAEDKPRTAKWWVQWLPRQVKPLRTKVGQNLVARGVLSEQQHRVLGLFATTRFPVHDPTPERNLRERLRQVLLDERDPQDRDVFILAVVRAQRRIRTLVPKDARKQAEERAKQTAQGDLVGKAVQDSVKEMQAAIIASVTTAVVASTGTGE
jgi:golgi phosphoprotein 3